MGYVLKKTEWKKDPIEVVPIRTNLFSRFGGLLETDILSKKSVYGRPGVPWFGHRNRAGQIRNHVEKDGSKVFSLSCWGSSFRNSSSSTFKDRKS